MASTTTAYPGAESGTDLIGHLSTGITHGLRTTSVVPDTAVTGDIARPTTGHPTPGIVPSTVRPRTIRAIQAFAHPPIARQPIVLPAIARQPSSRFQTYLAIAHRTALAPRPVSPELAHQMGLVHPTELVLRQANPASNPRDLLPGRHPNPVRLRNSVQEIQAASQARADHRRNPGPQTLISHKA